MWKPNSPKAVANIANERAYYELLDSKCEELRDFGPKGGVGWFAHIYKDDTLPGWGVVDGLKSKFMFKPRVEC